VVFNFSYKGGVHKPDEHKHEKFFIFFLIGDKEIPLYQLLRDGLVQRREEGSENYVTAQEVVKVFTSRQGFGIQKFYHSFYMKLENSNIPSVTLFPFTGERGGTGFYFKTKGIFLKRSQVLALLPEEAESRPYVERQEVLPIDLMNKMIVVNREEVRKKLRVIHI